MHLLYFIACLALCPVVLCDYQVEIQLVQYSNPTGRLANGGCCDLASGQGCSPTDTCDVQFIFTIQNFATSTTFHSQTLGAGRYDDVNEINFPTCSDLPSTSSAVASNPLTFVLPSSNWTGTQTLRMTATIQDFDPPAGSTSSVPQEIATPFLDIVRPSSPSNTFSDVITFSQGSATMMARYRVICTVGSCGNDCSQTTGCSSWMAACDGNSTFTTSPPATTVPSSTNPCFPSPCLNGGACDPIRPGVFECQCINGYHGDTCQLDPATTQNPQTTVVSGPTDMESTTASSTSQNEGSGSGTVTIQCSQWTIVWTTVLLLNTLLYYS